MIPEILLGLLEVLDYRGFCSPVSFSLTLKVLCPWECERKGGFQTVQHSLSADTGCLLALQALTMQDHRTVHFIFFFGCRYNVLRLFL